MVYLPNEMINYILMFRMRHPLFTMMKYLIDYSYKKDFYMYKNNEIKNYCYDYSFVEWYFILVRLRRELNKPIFRLTPQIIPII